MNDMHNINLQEKIHQIIWIDPSRVSSQLMEKICESKSIPIYMDHKIEEIGRIIGELNPYIVIIHKHFMDKIEIDLFKQYSNIIYFWDHENNLDLEKIAPIFKENIFTKKINISKILNDLVKLRESKA